MKYLETRLRDMVEEKLLMGASSESTRTSGLWSRSWHRAIVSSRDHWWQLFGCRYVLS